MELYPRAMRHLKAQLKSRRVSQHEFARTLGVPESTLKKWLNADDGSLERVHRLCEALGLSIGDLFKSLERAETQTFRFSDSQQSYFLENPSAFALFWRLVYERRPFDEAARLAGLKTAAARAVVYRLDRLGLLEARSDDQIVLPRLRPVRWAPKGRFMERLYRDWTMAVVSRCLGDGSAILQYFQLTPESAEELRRDLRRLEEKFSRKTIEDLSLGTERVRGIRFAAGLAEGGPLDAEKKESLPD